MILWLNGPYGVGKSTLAEVLHAALPESFILDAEDIGNAIRDNMPEMFYHETFEEYPLWRKTCVRLLTEISRGYVGHVMVPMTLMYLDSMDIFTQLKAENVDICHVMLVTDETTIHQRIVNRGEDMDCWCARQTVKCLEAQTVMPCDLRVWANQSSQAVAMTVIEALGLK